MNNDVRHIFIGAPHTTLNNYLFNFNKLRNWLNVYKSCFCWYSLEHDMCTNDDCQYHCRTTPKGFSCYCPEGMKLKPDNKTCIGNQIFSNLIFKAFHNFITLYIIFTFFVKKKQRNFIIVLHPQTYFLGQSVRKNISMKALVD